MLLIYNYFSLIQTFFLLLYCPLGFSSESSLSSKPPFSQNQPSSLLSLTKNSHRVFYKRTRTMSFTKELAPCLLIEVRSTIGDEEWSFENIGSTLNIGTQNFDLIGFLSCLNLLFYRTSWWFGGFEWFSIVLHHYLGLGFGFLFLFSLSVFSSVLNLFSIFSV